MKTLLMYPPATLYKKDPTVPGAFPPLGLGYIAAVLKQNGYEVNILDSLALGIDRVEEKNNIIRFGLSEKYIEEYIEQYQPDIVGISCHFTAHAKDAYRIAEITKKINPKILVVAGGAHACARSEELLRTNNVDIVVRGEGENTFLEIVKKKEKDDGLSDIIGTVVKKNGEIIYNPERPLIRDLDSIPFPARDLLPMEKYFSWKQSVDNYDMRHPNTSVVTSRGCPMSCVFCSIHSIWGEHQWRARSAKNVVNEIEFLVDKYGVGEIQFVDDNLTFDKNRITNICNEIIDRKIDIKWSTPNGVAVWTLDEDLLLLMKKSGCYRLSFGIESGSYDTQKFIGKRINLGRTQELIKYAQKIGIWTIGFFIIGFPYETRNSIDETIQYAINSDLDYATFYLPMPFPGTRLSDVLEKENLLNDIESEEDYAFSLTATRGCKTRYFTPAQLQELKDLAYKSFMNSLIKKFINPFRILNRIKSWEDFFYSTKLIRKGLILFLNKLKYIGKPGYRPIGMRRSTHIANEKIK